MTTFADDERRGDNRLARAQRGDQTAFAELTDPHRRELQLHCYRILGSVHDAEDLLQETLLAAWQGLERFEGRSPLRTWLYAIATNRCLNALRERGRRPVVVNVAAKAAAAESFSEISWLEPYPDSLLQDLEPGPESRYEAKESVALAFVGGLQHLAPRQRAVLVLRDVLGFHADEVAEMLAGSPASVNSALQRARATLQARAPQLSRDRLSVPDAGSETTLLTRFAEAFQADDIDRLVQLLTDDVTVSMPPQPAWYTGRDAVGEFLRERAAERVGPIRFVATRANGQPAAAYYLDDARGPVCGGLFVLGVEGDRIASMTRFALDDSQRAAFGVPERL